MDRLSSQEDRIADRIRQHRQQSPDVPVLIVEGSSDKRLLLRIFPSQPVAVFPVSGRANVFATAADLEVHGIARWACLVDRDFDSSGEQPSGDIFPLLRYDNADLESMLWLSPAYDTWIDEAASSTKLATLGGLQILRHLVTESIAPLQRLRAANTEYRWGLNFDELDIRKKCDKASLALQMKPICDALWYKECGATKERLYRAAESYDIPQCPHSGHPLMRGKDAIVVTGVALRKLIGGYSHQATDAALLETALRLAAETRHLDSTNWYHELATFLKD